MMVDIRDESWSKGNVDVLPQGILENAIKITNEPPTGMHANLHAALDNFDQVNAAVASFAFLTWFDAPLCE